MIQFEKGVCCKICANQTLKFSLKDQKIYYHCQNCDYLFLDSTFYITKVEEKKRYSLHQNTIENQGYVSYLMSFIHKGVRPFVHKGQKVLDFGCGPGPVLCYLMEKEGLKVRKFDPFFYPAPFEEFTYDLITATEVIEHLHYPVATMEKLLCQLKKGGYLSLMTYFHQGLQHFENWKYRRDETHVGFFSRQTFSFLKDFFQLQQVYCDNEKVVVFKKYS